MTHDPSIHPPSRGTLRNQLLRGGLGSIALKPLSLGVQLAAVIVLARLLGPDGFGVYALALAVVSVLSVASQLGYPSLLVRLTAIYHAERNFEVLKALTIRSAAIVTGSSLALAAVVALGVALSGAAEPLRTTLLLSLALLPVLGLLANTGGLIRGFGRVVLGQVPQDIIRPALLLLLVLVIASQTTLDPVGAVGAYLLASALALCVGVYLLRLVSPSELRSSRRSRTRRTWLRDAAPFLFLAGAQTLNHHVDVLMVGLLTRSESQVGLYRVAVQVSDGVGMALVAIAAALAPHLARLHAQKDFAALKTTLVYGHRAGIFIVAPLAIAIAVWSRPILELVFGSPYAGAAIPLVFLVLGKVLYASVALSGVAVSMFGHAGVATVCIGLAAVLNVVLNVLLIPIAGITGAAAATAFSGFTGALLCIVWIRMSYGINVSAVGSARA